jgi:hypothetical protein
MNTEQAKRVAEPARDVPVRGEVDVLVAGGGLGGVAAAMAAARAGAKTLLVERNTFAGGVATAGMCCSIFNCYYTSAGTLGTGGIAVEVADRIGEVEGFGPKWRRHKGHVIYDLETGKLVLAELVEESGAGQLYGAVVAGALIEDGALRGVIVETKSGREAILARVVVDATGDADIAAFAGVPLRAAPNGSHSLCFRMANVDVDGFVSQFREDPDRYPKNHDVQWTAEEAVAQYDDCGTFLFPHHGGPEYAPLQEAKEAGALPDRVGIQDTVNATQMHAIRRTGVVHIVTGYTHFDGLDADAITRSLLDGRKMAFVVAEAFRRYVPGFAHSFVAGTAANLGVRTSRCLDGDFTFTRAMLQGGTRHPDVVGRGVGWEHRGAQCLFADSFDLPYRCLLPRGVDGLLAGAGRSVSSENHSLLRVMVHTMVVGQAAGAAAAVAIRTGTTPQTVAVDAVQAELRRQGVVLRDGE